MKIDGRCHCRHITYEADIDPDKILICHCTDCQTLSDSAFRVVAYNSGRRFQVAFGRTEKSTSRPAEAGINGHNRSVRNVERQFGRRRLGPDSKFTPFQWAPFVNAIKSPLMYKYGLFPRSHGSRTLDRCERSKSSRRLIKPAR